MDQAERWREGWKSTFLCVAAEGVNTPVFSERPADGAFMQRVFLSTAGTAVGPMESWSDLRLPDLTFNFLNCDTNAKERF